MVGNRVIVTGANTQLVFLRVKIRLKSLEKVMAIFSISSDVEQGKPDMGRQRAQLGLQHLPTF